MLHIYHSLWVSMIDTKARLDPVGIASGSQLFLSRQVDINRANALYQYTLMYTIHEPAPIVTCTPADILSRLGLAFWRWAGAGSRRNPPLHCARPHLIAWTSINRSKTEAWPPFPISRSRQIGSSLNYSIQVLSIWGSKINGRTVFGVLLPVEGISPFMTTMLGPFYWMCLWSSTDP